MPADPSFSIVLSQRQTKKRTPAHTILFHTIQHETTDYRERETRIYTSNHLHTTYHNPRRKSVGENEE